MGKSFFSSTWLPYVVAILLFVVLNVFYFAPQFQGQEIYQHDVAQYQGMTQDILEHREKYGEDPQWTGNMFGGMPAYLINVKYDGTIIKSISKIFYFLGQPAALIFIAMTCFFLMLLCMGVNPWVGIIPALAYGLSSYFLIIIVAGHITKMMALAFAPMLFGGVFYAYRRNMWIGAALTAFFGTIQIGVNHLQITYYFGIILLVYWIYEFIRAYKEKLLSKFAKTTGLLLLAGVLAVGSNAGMLYYIQKHSVETMRGGSELTPPEGAPKQSNGLSIDYATTWSYGKAETFNLLIPGLYGESTHGGFSPDGEVAQSLTKYQARNLAAQLPSYWGPQPSTYGPVYIGAVAIFIAVLGMFLLRGRSKWWLAGLTLLAVFLSWGKHMMWFTELFYNFFPGYNKFRTLSMILVIAEWTVPVLMALTLQQIWKMKHSATTLLSEERARFNRSLKYSLFIVGGIALFFALFGKGVMSFSSPFDGQMQIPEDVLQAMRDERASMLRTDAVRSLALVMATAGVLWLFWYEKIKQWLFIVLLSGSVIVDMVPVDMRYLGHDKFEANVGNTPKPTEADKMILQDTEPGFRVFNVAISPFQDATTSYFHRSVGGYHGAKLQIYQDLIDRYISKMDMGVLNMLNTKYIIYPDQQAGTSIAEINPDANGPVWFVSRVEFAETADQEIAMLGEIDNKTTAVVRRNFEGQLSDITPTHDSTATIRMTEYRSNLQRYEYSASTPTVAIFSEIYYTDGWKAYIDGEEAPYFKADYVLRGMVVPAGTHTVEFRFRAPHYGTLTTVTWICSLIILAGCAGAIVYTVIRKRKRLTSSESA